MPLPSDPADLFAHLVVGFDTDFNRHEVFGWMSNDRVSDIASLLEGAALDEGGISPERVEELLDVADPDDYSRQVFAVLLGLDRALLYANPYVGHRDQSELTTVALRYAATGALNSDPTLGVLLPRCAYPARQQFTPNSLNDAFMSVVWVPRSEWSRVDHRRIRPRNDLTRRERESGFVLVCVPFIDDADDFDWSVQERDGGRFFRVALRDGTPVAERIRLLLDELDLEGSTIAVLPELALTDTLLDEWQQALSDRPPPGESRLKWLVVGSGDTTEGTRPVNRCVVLDRVTGEIVLTQDKISPFTLTEEQLGEWKLGGFLGAEAVEEDIESGRRVTVFESGLGRMVVLICEDLARLFDLGPALRSHGVSHIFAPVFSKETKPHHWEHAKAKEYATEAGALVVISNSLVVPRLMEEHGPWGTSLVHSPVTTQLRRSENWNDQGRYEIVAGDPVPRSGDSTVTREDDLDYD